MEAGPAMDPRRPWGIMPTCRLMRGAMFFWIVFPVCPVSPAGLGEPFRVCSVPQYERSDA